MGWKLFVSVDDFSALVMHETFSQIKRAVYSLSGGFPFRNGDHEEKAADDSAATLAGLRNRESSGESQGRTWQM